MPHVGAHLTVRHTELVAIKTSQGDAGPVAGPTVVRRQLGRRLRRLRDGLGVSVEQVVANRKLGISRAKLYKLEAGKHPAKPQDVAALCGHYGATPDETEALTALALGTQDQSWWHVYGESAVPEWFSLYVDLEPAATKIRTYESELIPGLLQTPAYAWAVYRAMNPRDGTDEIERRVAVRMERQAILRRAKPPKLHVVLNEAALLREVGGAEVMDSQFDKLRQATAQRNVEVDVLPLRAGAHAAMETTFVILDFPVQEDDPPVVYMDSPTSAAYLQKPHELSCYETIFGQIAERAVSFKEYMS